MEIFWNAGGQDKIQGMDILGLRQLDQSLEKNWVSSISTISIRARYLTLLPWMLVELYEYELKQGGGKATIDNRRLTEVLGRLKFTILAASAMENDAEEVSSTYGVLGSEIFGDQLGEFKTQGKIELPSHKGADFYGTYVMPCRGFGLLVNNHGGESLPISVSPRGRELYRQRDFKQGCRAIRDLLMEGGVLTSAHLTMAGRQFSVNGLLEEMDEQHLLTQFMLNPYCGDPDVIESYNNFNATVRWAATFINDGKLRPAEIIAHNFQQVVTSAPEVTNKAALAWMEYELRRRVHFACELLMSDLSETLSRIGSGTIEEVIESWMHVDGISTVVSSIIGFDETNPEQHLGELVTKIEDNSLLGTPLQIATGRDLPAGGNRAFYGLALLLASYRQTQRIRKLEWLENRQHCMEKAFACLEGNQTAPVSCALCDLVMQLVVKSHLNTTLRKMSQGQKCSLRFFPEGNVLHSTGVLASPGFSDTRLNNVLGMLADVGLCSRLAGGYFFLTDAGRDKLVMGNTG